MMTNRNQAAPVNLQHLANELGKLGMDIKPDEINLIPDPSLETPEVREEIKYAVLQSFKDEGFIAYNPNTPTLNWWGRAKIKYHLGY